MGKFVKFVKFFKLIVILALTYVSNVGYTYC